MLAADAYIFCTTMEACSYPDFIRRPKAVPACFIPLVMGTSFLLSTTTSGFVTKGRGVLPQAVAQ